MSCLHRIWFHLWFFLTLFYCQTDPPALCAASTDVNHAGRENKINLSAEGCDHTCTWLGGKRSSGSSGSPGSGCVLSCYCPVYGKDTAYQLHTLGTSSVAWLQPCSTACTAQCWQGKIVPTKKIFYLIEFSFFPYLKFRCYCFEGIAVKQPGRQGAMLWQISLA